jgi:hypothetical protein
MTVDCFDCLQPANYSAVALELQQTALQAESCIFELERSLRSVPNSLTAIQTSTADYAFPSGTRADLGLSTTTTTFSTLSNTNFMFPGSTPVLPAGVWQVGAFVNAVATGAVNANSYRYLYAAVRNVTDSVSIPNVYTAEVSCFEANIGNGMDMNLIATVVLNGKQGIHFQFLHNNTSSTIAIKAGAIYWAHRLSDQIALKVV